MNNKKGVNFFLLIIAIITGSKLIKDFDFKEIQFQHLAIDLIYLLAFTTSVIFLVKEFFIKPKS